MKIINPQSKDITMTHSHSYNITANYLIGCVCYKGINDILNDRKSVGLTNYNLLMEIERYADQETNIS